MDKRIKDMLNFLQLEGVENFMRPLWRVSMEKETAIFRGSHVAGSKSQLPRLLISIAFICVIFASCSRESAAIRSIPGHSIAKQGVAHGTSLLHAERYCQHCHGPKLLGGTEAQPSCYQCHGQRWTPISPELTFAPLDHTLFKGIYGHQESLGAGVATCAACHGADLKGMGESGPPSCYLCHGDLWTP